MYAMGADVAAMEMARRPIFSFPGASFKGAVLAIIGTAAIQAAARKTLDLHQLRPMRRL